MKRLVTMLGAVALAGALAFPVAAGRAPTNDELTFYRSELGINQPVDYLTWCGDCFHTDYTTGSPWVTNPTSCLWDRDDFYTFLSQGTVLAAGASVSVTACRYSPLGPEGGNDPAFAQIQSSSPDLLVIVSYAWQGGGVTSTPVVPTQGTSNLWQYVACWDSPIVPWDVPLVTVPGSNGGQAVPQTVTWTIINPGRKATKTGGIINADPRDLYGPCPITPPRP